MKRLACFLLEGLVEQGPHQVWVTLGAFESSDAARRAISQNPSTSVIDTRVIALYRDSGITTASNHRTHITSGTSATAHDSAGFTVA